MTESIPKNISPEALRDWLVKDQQKPVLIDVREENELAIAPFPEVVFHLPLSKSSIWIKTIQSQLQKKQPLVILCHAGIRSWHFGTWLLEQNWGLEVWNLEGGIDAWSMKVDPSVPRY